MPIDWSIDHRRDLVVTIAAGVVSDAEVVSYMRQVVHDAEVRSGIDALVDTREIERLEVTGTGVRQAVDIATRWKESFAGARWAVIAPRDVVYGMARMYELCVGSDGYQVRVCRDRDSAFDWLGLPAQEPRPSVGLRRP